MIFLEWKYIVLESFMPDPSLTVHVTEFTEIVRHLIGLKPRLKVVLPEDLARAKARFDTSHPAGKAGSVADYDLLFNIGVILSRRQEPVTMGELSQALDVPLSTATRIVDWLVKNAFAERLPDPDDRRIVRVALTETGQAMCRAGNEFIGKRVEQLLRPFTPEEREHLVLLLRKLVAALEEEA
jgi:DNA-binding MarR family transcriptional regulator